MNWDAIGAVGELIGAIAVIATLFYLAVQIRQNSRAVERTNEFANANSIHETNAFYSQVFAMLAQDAELADIYDRALRHESLNSIETVRFTSFMNSYFAWLEDVYHQQTENVGFRALPEITDTSFFDVCGPYVAKLLSTPAGAGWWDRDPSHQFLPEFVALIDAFMLTQKKPE
jgi:hypothetical protein